MTLQEQIKDKAELYFNTFDFNGYYLNKSNKDVQKEFAIDAIELLLIEIDDFILRAFWQEVKQEIEKL
jgi:hypothetical protein